jgi:hypothetical protein
MADTAERREAPPPPDTAAAVAALFGDDLAITRQRLIAGCGLTEHPVRVAIETGRLRPIQLTPHRQTFTREAVLRSLTDGAEAER